MWGLRTQCAGDPGDVRSKPAGGHSTPQTKAGLSLHGALKATCRKLAPGASLPQRPTQRPPRGAHRRPQVPAQIQQPLSRSSSPQRPLWSGAADPGSSDGVGPCSALPLPFLARGWALPSSPPRHGHCQVPCSLHSGPGRRTQWEPHGPQALLRGWAPPSGAPSWLRRLAGATRMG